MGGAGDHMSHPFDLDEVKNGADLIKVLMSVPAHVAMEDAVNATIKLDGSNNSVKMINRRGYLEFALDRGAKGPGKGDLDHRGLTSDDFGERDLNPGLQSSSNILLGILNEALKVANLEPELKALGLIDEDEKPDLSKFLNTEFYDKENPNSIKYPVGNFIAFHGIYQFYEKYYRRGTPDKNVRTHQIRTGLPRLTYTDQKDNKEKYKKSTSVRIPYDGRALESLVEKITPYAAKEGFKVFGPGAVRQKNEQMAKETIADMKASLAKPITIQISKDKAETKSLKEWLEDSVNPLTTKYGTTYLGCADCIRLADGTTTNPYNKIKVYEPIINGEPIVDNYANSDGSINAKAAIDSAILFHATRLLGQDIKNHLTTEIFGDLAGPLGHEGIVIRDLASEDFKITGEFMVDDSGGFAQKRRPSTAADKGEESPITKDEFLEEAFEIIEDEDEDPVVDSEFTPKKKTVAIVPGAFKPPHQGHADMVQKYANKADKVIILISKPTVAGRYLDAVDKKSKKTEILQSHAKKIWEDVFLPQISGAEIEIKIDSDYANPIQAAYDYIGTNGPLDPKEWRVILGASDKPDDNGLPDWHRWKGAHKYAKPGLEIMDLEGNAVKCLHRACGIPFSATTMRDLISALRKEPHDPKVREELSEFIPADMINDLLSIFEPLKEESGVGAVGGYAASFPLGSSSVRKWPAKKKKRKKKPSMIRQENTDLSLVEEVLELIIGRGVYYE